MSWGHVTSLLEGPLVGEESQESEWDDVPFEWEEEEEEEEEEEVEWWEEDEWEEEWDDDDGDDLEWEYCLKCSGFCRVQLGLYLFI